MAVRFCTAPDSMQVGRELLWLSGIFVRTVLIAEMPIAKALGSLTCL